jgi:hypothetical protein
MSFVCECCEYNTNLRANLSKHLLSNKHKKLVKVSTELVKVRSELVKVTPEIVKVKKIICKYCEKEYKHKSSLSNHIKYRCTKNKDEDLKELVRLLNLQLMEQGNEIKQHKTHIQEHKTHIQLQDKKIEKLMGKLEINGSFNTTNIQNNFTLLGYRDTDLSHLTDEDYRFCIKKINHCVKTLIDKVHFNPLKPENRNIYISNMKDKYLMVYDGSNWNLANKKDELDRLFEEKEMMLEDWLESNPDPVLKDKFMKYLNNKEDDVCLNQIKEEIKLMLYNKGELVSLE